MKPPAQRVWSAWKKFAHRVGVIQARIILCIFYFLVFGFVALWLFFLRRDLLNVRRARQGRASSDWISREPVSTTLVAFRHQF